VETDTQCSGVLEHIVHMSFIKGRFSVMKIEFDCARQERSRSGAKGLVLILEDNEGGKMCDYFVRIESLKPSLDRHRWPAPAIAGNRRSVTSNCHPRHFSSPPRCPHYKLSGHANRHKYHAGLNGLSQHIPRATKVPRAHSRLARHLAVSYSNKPPEVSTTLWARKTPV